MRVPGNGRGVYCYIERPILLDKVKEIGHLLQVGRHIGIVTGEVNVVEFHVHHVFNFS